MLRTSCLFLSLLICIQANGNTSSLFSERVGEVFSRCSNLAGVEGPGVQEVRTRQQRFDQLYGLGVFAEDPEFRSFLIFMDLVVGTHRLIEAKDAVLGISDIQTSEVVVRLIEQFEADFKFIGSYFERLKTRLPKLKDAFQDLQKFTDAEIKDWITEKNYIRSLGAASASGVDQAEARTKLWARVQGTLSKMRGFYTEFQLSLRVPRPERAGFYLKEYVLEHMSQRGLGIPEGKKKLSEIIDYLETLDLVIGAFVDQLEAERVVVDPNDPKDSPHRARIRYLLTKEMDLEARAEDGSLIWYEPKNYEAVFKTADYHGPRGKSLKKQVKVSVILRKIVTALFPERQIRLEFHFLNGITPHPKARFEALFEELGEKNLGVVGEVADH